MKILGLDIGGANVKAGLIDVSNGKVSEYKSVVKYLPLWKDGKEKLSKIIQEVSKSIANSEKIDAVGITMTAELSDVFKTKQEGVEYILRNIEKQTSINPKVIDYNGNFVNIDQAIGDYLTVSSANWAATSKILSKIFHDCILIDSGSSTTDIIPVIKSKVISGKTDIERLSSGELVYTGILRNSIPSIVHNIPVKDKITGISSERFSLSGDIHLILGNISVEEYSTETADGRGKSRGECLARLARILCTDSDLIGDSELVSIADYIYRNQILKVVEGLNKVWNKCEIDDKKIGSFPIITTGMGGKILGTKAASSLGFTRFFDMVSIIGVKNSQTIPAVSTAILLADFMGEKIDWSMY